MDILISNLLSKLIFDFGKWSNWKYTYTRIRVFSVTLATEVIHFGHLVNSGNFVTLVTLVTWNHSCIEAGLVLSVASVYLVSASISDSLSWSDHVFQPTGQGLMDQNLPTQQALEIFGIAPTSPNPHSSSS